MISSAFLLVSLVSLALGKPATPNLVPHETLKAPPGGFSRVGPADPSQTLKLRLALVQGNVTELERKLYDVSTPSSPNYGKHLSVSEVKQLVAPTQESVDAVDAWLKEHGIATETISPSGDWRSFELPVSKANELFDADFSVFKHSGSGVEAVRTLSYSIPAELQGHLDLVHPTVSFPDPRGQQPMIQTPMRDAFSIQNLKAHGTVNETLCANITIPYCLQGIYNITTRHATQPSNKLAVSGFNDDFPSEDDLEVFLTYLRPDISNDTTFAVQFLDGGANPQNATLEGNLNIQYTVGLATGVPTTFISVGQAHTGVDGFLDLAHFVLDQGDPPSVLSTSYGIDEEYVSPRFANNLCNTFAQLGAYGVSVLFSSGNGGVGGFVPDNECTDFVPTFPSSCPFVTSVGATQDLPEVAANFSAGGFSNIFRAPAYQRPVVSDYLAIHPDIYPGLFNGEGRGFPDVAARGTGYVIVFEGNGTLGVEGTAASTTVFASIIALLNDGLTERGRPPLGFVNPLFYSSIVEDLFNNITEGSNPGCGTPGFTAHAGWNPVTGLGSPDYEKLQSVIGI